MDVVQILEKLELLGFIKLYRVIGNYQQIYCPFHSDGQERKPSCGVLLKEEWRNGQKYPKGWVHCFSCGYVNTLPEAISDMLEAKSIPKSGMDWLIENIPGFEGSSEFEFLVPETLMSTLQNQYALDYIQRQTYPAINYVPESELATYRFTVPYMYERKLTDELIDKFDVGVDLNWVPEGRKKPLPCITFPVRDIEGRTLFLCRRSIEGKFFHYPEGVTKPVYGIDMVPPDCKSVVICESIFNCLTCWLYGYPAVALLGTGNAYQIQQLKTLGIREYVICMDGDDAGKRATKKLQNALKTVAIVWKINMLPGKDVNDLSKDEFDQLYKNKE